MWKKDDPIAVFDSGVGGLTVLKELLKLLPNEYFIYLGDTARTPYGTRSPEKIKGFAVENIIFLAQFSPKLIVVACNTVSSTALDYLRSLFAVPIIGVIKPGAKTAVKVTKNNKIGVIGTTATITSSAYANQIKALSPEAEVYGVACPLFVPLAEQGFLTGKIPNLIAKEYLSELKRKGIDTLLLGCTHYPMLLEPIRKVMGKKVSIVDSAKSTAEEVKFFLSADALYNENEHGELKFLVTDSPERFKRIGETFLEREIAEVSLVRR